MRAVSWALVVAMTVISCSWLALVWDVWRLRRKFEIAARSPRLVCISQMAVLFLVMSILLHWLLSLEDRSLPCYGIFWTSYFVISFGFVPTIIRAARLTVAFNKGYHTDYARFVKWKPMLTVWAVAVIGLIIRGIFFFGERPEHRSRNSGDCFYFDDVVLLVGISILSAGPMMRLAKTLSNVRDAFKIRQELEGVLKICPVWAGMMVMIQVFVRLSILPDSRRVHIAEETFAILIGVTMKYYGLLIPSAAYHNWCGSVKHGVYPVEGELPGEATLSRDGVLDYAMNGGETSECFQQICQEHLCMESWGFVVETVRYKTATMEPDDQFSAYLRILNQYLLPSSPDEVNICSAMSQRVSSFKTRETFASLNEDMRREIFNESLEEIVRILQENLLTKFRQRMHQRHEMEVAEAAKGDRELMELMSSCSARGRESSS